MVAMTAVTIKMTTPETVALTITMSDQRELKGGSMKKGRKKVFDI